MALLSYANNKSTDHLYVSAVSDQGDTQSDQERLCLSIYATALNDSVSGQRRPRSDCAFAISILFLSCRSYVFG